MANYIKFVRGTVAAFNKLTKKDDDTLYFITNTKNNIGKIYLGSQQLLGNEIFETISLTDLKDVDIKELQGASFLVYDANSSTWINKTKDELVFTGATTESNGVSGFVPAPTKNNTLSFLRSDGQWIEESEIKSSTTVFNEVNNSNDLDNLSFIAGVVSDKKISSGDMFIVEKNIGDKTVCYPYFYNGTQWIPIASFSASDIIMPSSGADLETIINNITSISVDNKSIALNEQVMSLYNFGKVYYNKDGKQTDGWKEGLEPRVIKNADDEYCLAWYEPNTQTVDGLTTTVEELQRKTGELETNIGDASNSLEELKNIVGDSDLKTGIFKILNNKANTDNVYNKEETRSLIISEINDAGHLKRITVESEDKINTEDPNADRYIYMVPSGLQDDDNKYYEYIVVETDAINEDTGETIKIKKIEKIGSWEVKLDDYALKTDIKVTEVDDTDFTLTNGKLFLNKINFNKMSDDFVSAFNEKIESKDVITQIESGRNTISGLYPESDATKLLNLLNIKNISSEFSLSEENVLSIASIDVSKINGIDTLGYVGTEAFNTAITELQQMFQWTTLIENENE